MDKGIRFTYILLIVFTILTAVVSAVGVEGNKFIAFVIMALAGTKFLLVAFHFMELKKAHSFWKFSTLLVCMLIVMVFGIFSIA